MFRSFAFSPTLKVLHQLSNCVESKKYVEVYAQENSEF